MVTVSDDWLGGIAERLARQGRLRRRPHGGAHAEANWRRNCPTASALEAAGGTVEKLRRVKDEAELAAIAAAAELADEVWRWSLERGLAGRSELDVARAAEARMRELGAEPSFPTIVAAGPNGALPHAEPGEREIGTRRAGRLRHGREARRLLLRRHPHLRHRRAGRARPRGLRDGARGAGGGARRRSRPGSGGEDVDAVARELIAAAGHGERFGHGLGHGVGLEVHEEPRVSPRSEDVLAAGEVVTIEPGIYLPGELGVRIEDLVVVTEEGYRNLSGLPKELQLVD